MCDSFCCVPECHTFTWKSATYFHRACLDGRPRTDLTPDASWGTLATVSGVTCGACAKQVVSDRLTGHYVLCPKCLASDRHRTLPSPPPTPTLLPTPPEPSIGAAAAAAWREKYAADDDDNAPMGYGLFD